MYVRPNLYFTVIRSLKKNHKMSSRLKVILNHIEKNTLSTNTCSINYVEVVEDKEFKYTCNGSRLTTQQRQFYDDNGYLVIKNLVNDHILNTCREYFVAVCNGDAPPGRMFLMQEPTLRKAGAKGEHLYYKIQDLLHDKVFSQYTALPELLDYVECFTGPNITAIHSMLINKPPNAQETTIHPLHQDLLYFPFRPADLMVGAWTAMEPIDSENGCLVVIPGSHKAGKLYSHSAPQTQVRSYKTFYGVSSEIKQEPIPLHMDPGDTVFLHPLVVHGSGPNRSKRFRKAISCHYAASECNVINTEGTVHSSIAQDLEATALKKYGFKIDFPDIMKIRSVVVRGTEGFTAM